MFGVGEKCVMKLIKLINGTHMFKTTHYIVIVVHMDIVLL